MRTSLILISLLGGLFSTVTNASTKSNWTTLACGGYTATWSAARQGGNVCLDSKKNAYLVIFGGLGVSKNPLLLQGSLILVKSTAVEGMYVGIKVGTLLNQYGAFLGGYRKSYDTPDEGQGRAYVFGGNLGGFNDIQAASELMMIVRMN